MESVPTEPSRLLRNGHTDTTETRRFDAFISYSHAADDKLAPTLQSALQGFAKPWYRRRALHVFRDKSSLSATPSLWPSIESALSNSAYFVLLASPEAAASRWVQQEIDWWLEHRSPQALFIVVTDGSLTWDDSIGDFDWQMTTALPANLKRVFSSEPLWVDLRWARHETQLSPKAPRFQDAIADLASPLHGRPKDDLVGEDVRQHRRAIRLARAAVTALVLLAVGLALAAGVAWTQRDAALQAEQQTAVQRDLAIAAEKVADERRLEAERQQRIAEQRRQVSLARQVAAQSLTVSQQPDLIQRALGLAAEGLLRFASPETDQSVRRTLALLPPNPVTRLEPANDLVAALAVSLDGRRFAVSSERRVQIVELPGWRQVASIESSAQVAALAFSPDGESLAVGNWMRPTQASSLTESSVEIWTVASQRKVATIPFSRGIRDLAYGINDDLAVATGNTVRIVEIPSGREKARITEDARSEVMAVAYSGDHLATTTGVGARVFQVRGQPREVSSVDAGIAVGSVALTLDGRYLATGENDGRASPSARLWRVAGGTEVVGLAHMGAIHDVAFSLDGRFVATAGEDHTARIWQVPEGRELVRMPHSGAVGHVAFGHENVYLATSAANEALLWQVQGWTDGEPIMNDYVTGVAFTPDGRFLAVTSWYNRAYILQTSDWAVVATMDHGAQVWQVASSPDGRSVATAELGGTIRLFDVPSGQERRQLTGADANQLSFTPDGRYLVATSESQPSRVWDLATGQVATAIVPPDARAVAFSADGRYRAFAQASTVEVQDAGTGVAVTRLQHEGPVYMLAFSSDGNRLAVATGKIALVWDVSTQNPVARTTPGDDDVRKLALGSSGRYLATASGPNVRIWDVSVAAEITNVRHSGNVVDVQFSPDERELITATAKDNARRWLYRPQDLVAEVCSHLTQNLSVEEWTQYLGDEPYRETCPPY
jgi:WD40 repeat protein